MNFVVGFFFDAGVEMVDGVDEVGQAICFVESLDRVATSFRSRSSSSESALMSKRSIAFDM